MLKHGECLPCYSRPFLRAISDAEMGHGDRKVFIMVPFLMAPKNSPKGILSFPPGRNKRSCKKQHRKDRIGYCPYQPSVPAAESGSGVGVA